MSAAADPWTLCMRRGDFTGAWAISDRALVRRRGVPCWHWPRHQQYVWTGEPLAGRRVLVRCYHGLGDTVQFARFLPRLGAVAAEVNVWAQPELIPLLRGMRGVNSWSALHEGTPDIAHDAEIELMEIAHYFRVREDELARTVPYLSPPTATWITDATAEDNLAVGIVWRAGNWDARRSISPDLLEPLAQLPGVSWHVLQQAPEPCTPFAASCPTGNVAPVSALAAAIAALDLLISVDSLPAHLGGALGVPTWTLLPADADWRWMERRTDTPWYPSMRLFRQSEPGNWERVIADVASELQRVTARRLSLAGEL